MKSITLPSGIVDRGSSAKLLAETQKVVEDFTGVPTWQAALATAWNATTHFADLLPSPPALLISGSDINCAMALLQILSCTARHSIILSEVSQDSLRSLAAAQPTLLINSPVMSQRRRTFFSISNYRGTVLPGPRGTLHNVVSSKAFFLGTERPGPYEPGVTLNLDSARSNPHSLDAAACLQLRNRFQPWWLHHRLKNLGSVRRSGCVTSRLAPAMSQLAQIFRRCTENSSELEEHWAPMLQLLNESARERQCWDPLCAIVEVVWPRLHRREQKLVSPILPGGSIRSWNRGGESANAAPNKSAGYCELKDSSLRLEISEWFSYLIVPTASASMSWSINIKMARKVAGCPDCATLPDADE